MKKFRGPRFQGPVTGIALAVAIVCGVTWQPHPVSAQEFSIIDIGTFGGSTSTARSINNLGQVVGEAKNADGFPHGFLWADGRMIDLGTLPRGRYSLAHSINENGVIAGTSSVDRSEHVCLWVDGMVIDLGTLPGGEFSGGFGLNLHELVAGYSMTRNGQNRAIIVQEGRMRNLGTLGGSFSQANGANDAGLVVGRARTDQFEDHAFLYSNGRMIDLGTLGGSFSEANAINSAGLIVGNARNEFGERHAFLYVDSSNEMVDLGTLGGDESEAMAINAVGWIVGTSTTAEHALHAYLHDGANMIDLNDRVPADSQWELVAAYGVNDTGWIVGQGLLQGQRRAFVLKPNLTLSHPEPGRAGTINSLSIHGGTPDRTIHIVYGMRYGNPALPGCPGVSLRISRPRIAGIIRADPTGRATLEVRVSRSASGRRVLIKAVELSECRASSVVIHDFPRFVSQPARGAAAN